MTYEVQGYKSQEDYDKYIYDQIDRDLINKKDALKIGKEFLKDYPIVKVQSSDREFIELLTK